MNVQEFAPLAKPEEAMHSTAANPEPTDERLVVLRVKSGCSNAPGELYERRRLAIYHTVVRILDDRQDTEDDGGLSVFLSTRARLLGIAYRILKRAADAEDLVQDVWVRWQTTDRSTVRDAAAFLVTMTRHLAINVIRCARSRRQSSFGSLLQESVDTCSDPQAEVEQTEKLRSAVVVLLQNLSPAERAAYVLRVAFDYSYREIANILRLEEANVRQLVTRARQHVVDGRHNSVNLAAQRSFLAVFLTAARKSALAKFESFLAGSAVGTVKKGNRPLRTLTDPIAVPLQEFCRLPELHQAERSLVP
jgi:RNA polymerase sigma factor (sigma-70 family)